MKQTAINQAAINIVLGVIIAIVITVANADPVFRTSEAEELSDKHYCVGKMEWLKGVYQNRDAGVPEEAMVNQLWTHYEQSDDPHKRERRFAWVDFERMLRDAYRKHGTDEYVHPDFEKKKSSEMFDCMHYRF